MPSHFKAPTLAKRVTPTQTARMKYLVPALCLALTACGVTAPGAPPPDAPPPSGSYPTGTQNTCDGERYGTLVGQDATMLERILIMRQIRVIRPGQVVTQDYRPERINFEIDAGNRIARIYCG